MTPKTKLGEMSGWRQLAGLHKAACGTSTWYNGELGLGDDGLKDVRASPATR